MIAFDSPEGATLRALQPSRSAMLAIWRTALDVGADSWATWAQETLAATVQDAEVVALRFMQSVRDGDQRGMRQLWAVLGSFPPEAGNAPTVQAARNLRRTLQF